MNFFVVLLISGGGATTVYFLWDLVALAGAGGRVGSQHSLIYTLIAIVIFCLGLIIRKKSKTIVPTTWLFLIGLFIFFLIEIIAVVFVYQTP